MYGSYIDEPIIKVGTGGTVYYHANDLFSIAALTDTDGAPIERYAYTAYGVLTILAPDGSTVRSSSSYANPYTFTGRDGIRKRSCTTIGTACLPHFWAGSAAGIRFRKLMD